MIIEPSNYTYETMPDYTDAVDGAVEIPGTGEEIEIRYAHEVVYDEAHNLHLEIFTCKHIWTQIEGCAAAVWWNPCCVGSYHLINSL